MTLLRDVRRGLPERVEHRVVSDTRHPRPRGETCVDRRAHGGGDRAALVEQIGEPGTGFGRPLERDDAEADALDAARREVVEPGRVHGVVLGRPDGRATVTRPQFGVFTRILHLALHHERIEVDAVEPSLPDVFERLAVAHLPVAEELCDTTGFEVGADVANQVAHDGVTHRTAVAVLVLGHAGATRRDDERRVAHDEVESAAGDRFEHRTSEHLDVEIVEGGVEADEGERACREVRGDDVLDVAREVHGLNTAAGAEVEGGADGASRGPSCEGRRRATDAEHMIGFEHLARRDLREIRCQPP